MVSGGINRKCRYSIAGVSEIYLLKYYEYSRSQIITNDNFLVTFPTTVIYKFEVTPESTANEQQEQNEGGKFFNQSIGLSFRSSDLLEIENYWGVSTESVLDFFFFFRYIPKTDLI